MPAFRNAFGKRTKRPAPFLVLVGFLLTYALAISGGPEKLRRRIIGMCTAMNTKLLCVPSESLCGSEFMPLAGGRVRRVWQVPVCVPHVVARRQAGLCGVGPISQARTVG